MNTSYGIVLGSPRSGTTYLMSVLNTIPDMACLSGTVLPAVVPHVVNRRLTTTFTTLSRGASNKPSLPTSSPVATNPAPPNRSPARISSCTDTPLIGLNVNPSPASEPKTTDLIRRPPVGSLFLQQPMSSNP